MVGLLVTLLLGLGALVGAVFCGFVVYVQSVNRYFEKRGMLFDGPSLSPTSLMSSAPLQKSFSKVLADLYAKHKGHKLVGYLSLWKKKALVIDLEVIRDILVKDFDLFQDRGLYYNKENDPLSAHLFALAGNEWRTTRAKISPTFTSGKMKGMFGNIVGCAKVMISVAEKSASENQAVDCQALFSRYGLAVISSTAFGLDSDALTNKDSTFVKMANKLFAPTVERLMTALLRFNNDVARWFKMRVTPPDVSEFFMSLVKDAITYRQTNGIVRNDYLQLLIELRESGTFGAQGTEVNFSDKEVAAEAFVFIVAGSETTSRAMSFCLYELAMNPAVQATLLREVDALQEISYDSINNLEYLDMVVDETLRKYPPVAFLNRECSKDYRIAHSQTVLEKGTQVLISVQGLHYDPELFDQPEQFIPERFSKENKRNIKPYSYMPFGEGPRFCIGQRFGKMTVKTGLVMLLRRFQVHRTPSTPTTVQFEPRTVITTAAGGIWLRLVDRNTEVPLETVV